MGKKETVDVLVEGGKATPAPPIGPALAPLKVNVGKIVAEINEKTASFSGMQVPVKITVDTENGSYTITVGTPPVSSLLRKELKVQKLATVNEDKTRNLAGNVTFDKIVAIAKNKDSIYGDLKAKVKQILGTCTSCGVTVDGKNAKDVQKDVDGGKYNSHFS
mgnify:FL=1